MDPAGRWGHAAAKMSGGPRAGFCFLTVGALVVFFGRRGMREIFIHHVECNRCVLFRSGIIADLGTEFSISLQKNMKRVGPTFFSQPGGDVLNSASWRRRGASICSLAAQNARL